MANNHQGDNNQGNSTQRSSTQGNRSQGGSTQETGNRSENSLGADAQTNRNSVSPGDQAGGRGFAGMDSDQQRAVAAKGGRAAHASGNAHEFTSEEARDAGRRGGEASRDGSSNDRNNEGGNSRRGTGSNR